MLFALLGAPLRAFIIILAGNLMNSAGITSRIFDFPKALVGWMRGGLGHVNIGASVIFAGMLGQPSPMPAASAIAVPDMPEKITEPTMFTCARPPRIQPTSDSAKL